jgi:adenine-specific DNA-methyltransferase
MAKIPKSVETITHEGDTRTNIPTAEYENLMRDEDKKPVELKYPRNPDLDPQLVWRGKDEQDWSDLVVTAPPLYIQEKINPKHIIDDLMRQSKKRSDDKAQEDAPDLFADMFDGELDPKAKTEFYAHDQNWTNRMILGDSLQVMASLAEREGLRGKVQCIYFDPPYGIKFGSNWQVSTKSKTVKDGKLDQISREAEMVKAFRDTWSDGIHSYMTYLRDRLTISRDLLAETGSIIIQIGDENVHRVRLLLDEVFGVENFVSIIPFRTKTRSLGGSMLEGMLDFLVVYAKKKSSLKFRKIFEKKSYDGDPNWKGLQNHIGHRSTVTKEQWLNNSLIPKDFKLFRTVDLRPAGFNASATNSFFFQGKSYPPPGDSSWLTTQVGLSRLAKADRLVPKGKSLERVYFADDYPVTPLTNLWADTRASTDKIYVVQSSTVIVSRAIQMFSDPGDLVLDPTCGSGTTAFVSEQWGRRWITIDTSRVALSLARTRLSCAKFDFFYLSDSKEGINLERKISGTASSKDYFSESVKQGFVYHRVPHITLGSIANNTELDVIYENYQETLEPLRQQLNSALNQNWEEWEIPSEADATWPEAAKSAHAKWWEARIARQKEMDDSIVRNAETEYLYDRPYVDNSKVRVAGPFTVESLSPHKVLAVDDDGEFLANADASDGLRAAPERSDDEIDFGNVILEHLRTAGVQQAHKEDRIKFTSINPFPGKFISGDGRYVESDSENAPQKRAAIFIGPEYGTLGRADIVAAAREARDLQFNVLVCCAFNYDAHSSEIDKLADLPILKARMNPDLHMADELKNTGAGNLFVVFGEPDIDFIEVEDGQIILKINGVDVFHPSRGEVISGGPESIAAWFIDTDYNEESFFVRHAYFLGANDPYKQLKSALKSEIDEEAWESLYRDASRPFPKPETGRIAVKVINHLGDEVMKVFNIN